MRINRTMKTSVDELDTFIRAMILQDIENTSSTSINTKDIYEGFEYTKDIVNKTGKQGRVKTRIEVLKPGAYEASFTSKSGINTISYTYSKIDDHLVDLVYEEHFESDKKANSLNHSLMSKFYKRSNKKRINALLDRIEYLINEQPV